MIKKIIMLILCMITMLSITLLSSQNAEKSTELSVGISEKIVDTTPKMGLSSKVCKYFCPYLNFVNHAYFLYRKLALLTYATI